MPNWTADEWSAAEKGRLSDGMMFGLVAARSASASLELPLFNSCVFHREALADAGWGRDGREGKEWRTGVGGGQKKWENAGVDRLGKIEIGRV